MALRVLRLLVLLAFGVRVLQVLPRVLLGVLLRHRRGRRGRDGRRGSLRVCVSLVGLRRGHCRRRRGDATHHTRIEHVPALLSARVLRVGRRGRGHSCRGCRVRTVSILPTAVFTATARGDGALLHARGCRVVRGCIVRVHAALRRRGIVHLLDGARPRGCQRTGARDTRRVQDARSGLCGDGSGARRDRVQTHRVALHLGLHSVGMLLLVVECRLLVRMVRHRCILVLQVHPVRRAQMGEAGRETARVSSRDPMVFCGGGPTTPGGARARLLARRAAPSLKALSRRLVNAARSGRAAAAGRGAAAGTGRRAI